MSHPWFAASAAPRVLAHRGFVPSDAEGIVENTVAAFAAAHAIGARYVESDCQLTADGVVVFFHDDDLLRVTGDPRKIAAVRHDELVEIMADRGGLASAADTIEAFPTLRFNIDVKSPDAARPLGCVVAGHADRVLVTSFSDAHRRRALDAARRLGGEPATSAGRETIARLLAAVSTGSSALVKRVLRGVDAVQIPERQGPMRIVTPRLLRLVHDADVEVHVWTVNDRHDMDRLLALGVDGLVTDRADLALNATASRP